MRKRILSQVICDADGCLIWTGRTSGNGRGGGYPRFDFDGGTMAVHRAWWILENGPIPPRKQLDHACRKRLCISCTELVTHKQNQNRRAVAQRLLREAAT
jgi:HNH endonuclease